MSTGWRRQGTLPEGEPPVLLGEFCGRVARGSSREASPSAGTARGYSSHAYAAGILKCQVRDTKRADGRRNRSHPPRPWVFPHPSVDQARCARTHGGRARPAIVPQAAYVLVSGMDLG
jgi:hypothetical protein